MKKNALLSFLILGLASALIISCAPPVGAVSDASDNLAGAFAPAPLQLVVTTDKALYYPGEIVKMTVMLTNASSRPVTINFGTTQRFDFTVSQFVKELWKWSTGKVFLPVTGRETILPGKSLTYAIAEYKAHYVPGGSGLVTLDLTGKITSTPGFAGKTQFQVSRYIPL